MKIISFLFAVVGLLLCLPAKGQTHFTERDTIDVLHYNICLDMGNRQPRHFEGSCEVTLKLLQSTAQVSLGLEAATIDSVLLNGAMVPMSSIGYDHHQLHIPVNGSSVGDTLRITVCYGSSGWKGVDGGFWSNPTMFYNLGEDRYTRPFSMGRSWFPCSDSVYDRATYTFAITAAPGWSAFCSGEHDSTVTHADSSQTFYYTLSHPVATYQVGINVAPYYVYRRNAVGHYGTYSMRIACFNPDSGDVAQCFVSFDSTLNRFERWFGPYRWGTIGFSAGGPNSGMEHVNNICMDSNVSTQFWRMDYLIDHEFAHQWFGNLITCDNLSDMWFNEGGATFADQIVAGKTYNRETTLPSYSKWSIIAKVPIDEEGFHPLCGMPDQYSFFSTTYNKGAMVFHELRHLLGDEVFFRMVQTLFDRNAFTNMDSYQLRDSMSLYSGVDLTDFYNFHIFSPGFASYAVDSLHTIDGSTTIWLRQLLWGAPEYNTHAKVPVTFFSATGDSTTRDVVSHGRYSQGQFQLPFAPDYAIVDYYGVTACANITEDVVISSANVVSCYTENVEIRPSYVGDTTRLKVSMQFGRADEPLPPGVKRWSSRRWVINGNVSSNIVAKVRFAFGDSYWVNDDGFYFGSATNDSIRLFYRRSPDYPWKMRKSATLERGNSSFGNSSLYMENGLMPGEFILAVVDTAQLSIPDDGQLSTTAAQLTLSPNPACDRVELQGFTTAGVLRILDASGHEVKHLAVNSPCLTLSTAALPAGIYFVSFTSSEGTSTKKLVVNR